MILSLTEQDVHWLQFALSCAESKPLTPHNMQRSQHIASLLAAALTQRKPDLDSLRSFMVEHFGVTLDAHRNNTNTNTFIILADDWDKLYEAVLIIAKNQLRPSRCCLLLSVGECDHGLYAGSPILPSEDDIAKAIWDYGSPFRFPECLKIAAKVLNKLRKGRE